MIDYQTILTQMSEAINSFESSESGYVKQEYIENDVEDGLENVKDTAIKYTEEANSIIDSVSDIVSITPIDESKLVDDVQKGKKNAEEIVEELYALDAEQVKALASVKEDLNDMRNFISDLETLFEDGDLSVENYSINAVRGLESYRSVYESIYGEGSIIDGSLKSIFEKLEEGVSLTYAERDELYSYIQDVIINDEVKEEMGSIVNMIGDGTNNLINRLNQEVLVSEESLGNEMSIIEAYLYNGNLSLEEHHVPTENIAKLKLYLEVLKNYASAIAEVKSQRREEISDVNNPLYARAEYIEYKEKDEPYTLSIKTDITISTIPVDNMLDRDEFLNLEDPLLVQKNESEVTYYLGANASKHMQHMSEEKQRQEYENFTEDYLANEISDFVMNQLSKQNIIFTVIGEVGKFQAKKNETSRKLTFEETKTATGDLKMEAIFSERPILGPGNKQIHVQLQPTNLTYNILDRWDEARDVYPNIPYPEEAIKKLDWYQIGTELVNKQAEIERIGKDLFNYIMDNEPGNNGDTEDVEK